jgi:hypothetical protein
MDLCTYEFLSANVRTVKVNRRGAILQEALHYPAALDLPGAQVDQSRFGDSTPAAMRSLSRWERLTARER